MAKRIDKHSETWGAIRDWAHQRRSQAVDGLIQGGTSPGHDDKLRGEIRAIDDLLALVAEPDPPLTPITY